ncbi:transferase [Kitasatospora sp. NPDC086791]|uniref:transferase n=1 Tax=Kitasatospora sp. NPDC086791 TaxID=3155178 RepID=UPI0034278191
MSSRLRNLARVVTALAVAAAYAALQSAIDVGIDRAGGRTGSDLEAAFALWSAVAALALAWPALWLRHRRRSGAAQLVGLVSRFVPRRPRWSRALRLADSVGLMLFGAGTSAVTVSEQRGHTMPLESQFLLLFGGLATLGAGLLVIRRTRPYAGRPAAQALLRDGREPVLYLRSFDDDEIAAQIDDGADFNINTREEQFVGALGVIGPVIAVGQPSEPLPRLGAARFYLPLDDWKSTVLRLMDLSQLIVLRLGQGDGLWWEVEQVRATQPAGKLLLLAPGGPSDLVARLNDHLPVPVPPGGLGPDEHWISAVIVFDELWTPRVFPVGPRRTGWRSWMRSPGLGAVETSTLHVARAVQAALASVGRRRRTMLWRPRLASKLVGLTGLGLAVELVLAGWLVYRALQLIALW